MTTTKENPMYSVSYGENTIEFQLRCSDRKTLEISVNPDASVYVKAPSGKPLNDIMQRVKKRAAWILKQQDFFSGYKPVLPERKYYSGETHRYLGKQYRLKITQGEPEQVKLKHGYIHVKTFNRYDKDAVRCLLEKWYTGHAKVKFQQRLEACYNKVRKLGINTIPAILIRKMNKRWGSCTSDGRIILNLDLMKAPSHCIDYVITHELCHLKHRNHNVEFFDMLYQLLPDWEQRKERLERIMFT